MAMLPKAIARGKADYPVRSVSYRPRTPSGEYIEIPDNLGMGTTSSDSPFNRSFSQDPLIDSSDSVDNERSTFENGIERTSSPVSFLNRSFSLDSLDDSLDVVDSNVRKSPSKVCRVPSFDSGPVQRANQEFKHRELVRGFSERREKRVPEEFGRRLSGRRKKAESEGHVYDFLPAYGELDDQYFVDDSKYLRLLGREIFKISDGNITASSQTDDNPAKHGLNSKAGSWSVGTDNFSQWLQIDLGDQNTKVTKVATQGKKGKGKLVTEYKLQYSEDGAKFQYYREQEQSAEKTFYVNMDQDRPVYHELRQPFRARYIRFISTEWHNHISVRVEVYGIKDRQRTLGMENGKIKDKQIEASSWRDDNHAAKQGRLNFKGSWSASTNDVNQWLQIDLDNYNTTVTGVATQGKDGKREWVTKYKLQYSDDGKKFQFYREQGREDKTFVGNKDEDGTVYHELRPSFMARYIRFIPTAWHKHISMRVEVYGVKDRSGPLGMESGAISDGQISASSRYGDNYDAIQGRLHYQAGGVKAGSWSAETNSRDQWLQIDLGNHYTKVTSVATQGRNGQIRQWVTGYKLQYSDDGVEFQFYREQGEKTNKTFLGNKDQNSVVHHVLRPAIRARYIRFRPSAWHDHISMRVEVYGLQENGLDAFLKTDIEKPWTVEEISATVTAANLCGKSKFKIDHIERIFQVNKKLQLLADATTENTEFLQNLADKVEDLAVELLDQVHTKEEARIKDKEGDADRYGSLFSEMTKKAIVYGQKKFVSHPFLYKRVRTRWQRGSPFKSVGIPQFVLRLFLIVIEAILTPLLLPLGAYAGYRDQMKYNKSMMTSEDRNGAKNNSEKTSKDRNKEKGQSKDLFEKYFDYINTPLVIFVKTEFMKLVFIALHCRICILGSSVMPTIEESLVFVFFLAVMLSEWEQWRTSESTIRKTVYFKDMWNWLDLLTMAIYIIIVMLRIIIIIRGGDTFHNRLLEIVHYCYGFNTMFLILRLSSILELSEVFGPLQLALFRMCVDLMTILVQFAFVVVAFSMALAKVFSAEMSYLTSTKNQTANYVAGYKPYCSQSAFKCLYKASRQLVWSVFGLMESEDLESHTSLTSEIVGVLFLFFLILSVIMLVNILVALLTNTYEKYRTNWEVEWKFGLAVVEEQYARRHAIVIPYNLLTYPILLFYLTRNEDTRKQNAEERKKKYGEYFRKTFFPVTTERYLRRYVGSFPMSVDEKLDSLQEKIQILEGMNNTKFDEIMSELKRIHEIKTLEVPRAAKEVETEQKNTETKHDRNLVDESPKDKSDK